MHAAIEVAGFPIEVFNVLGAGDAFMAGFLERLVARRAASRMRAPRQCVRRAGRVAPRLRAGDADAESSSNIFCSTAHRHRGCAKTRR